MKRERVLELIGRQNLMAMAESIRWACGKYAEGLAAAKGDVRYAFDRWARGQMIYRWAWQHLRTRYDEPGDVRIIMDNGAQALWFETLEAAVRLNQVDGDRYTVSSNVARKAGEHQHLLFDSERLDPAIGFLVLGHNSKREDDDNGAVKLARVALTLQHADGLLWKSFIDEDVETGTDGDGVVPAPPPPPVGPKKDAAEPEAREEA